MGKVFKYNMLITSMCLNMYPFLIMYICISNDLISLDCIGRFTSLVSKNTPLPQNRLAFQIIFKSGEYNHPFGLLRDSFINNYILVSESLEAGG